MHGGRRSLPSPRPECPCRRSPRPGPRPDRLHESVGEGLAQAARGDRSAALATGRAGLPRRSRSLRSRARAKAIRGRCRPRFRRSVPRAAGLRRAPARSPRPPRPARSRRPGCGRRRAAQFTGGGGDTSTVDLWDDPDGQPLASSSPRAPRPRRRARRSRRARPTRTLDRRGRSRAASQLGRRRRAARPQQVEIRLHE